MFKQKVARDSTVARLLTMNSLFDIALVKESTPSGQQVCTIEPLSVFECSAC